jgi:hypothetical protein
LLRKSRAGALRFRAQAVRPPVAPGSAVFAGVLIADAKVRSRSG